MGKPHKVPLYVSLKNVGQLDTAEPLLEHIDFALSALERRRELTACRVTVEGVGSGPSGVQVDVTFRESRCASFTVRGNDLFRAVAGAFEQLFQFQG